MGEIITKIIFFIFVLPYLMLTEGYHKFKDFMVKRNYPFDPLSQVLLALIILALLLLFFGYGYY